MRARGSGPNQTFYVQPIQFKRSPLTPCAEGPQSLVTPSVTCPSQTHPVGRTPIILLFPAYPTAIRLRERASQCFCRQYSMKENLKHGTPFLIPVCVSSSSCPQDNSSHHYFTRPVCFEFTLLYRTTHARSYLYMPSTFSPVLQTQSFSSL